MQERKKLNNPAQARNSFRQMVTGLILEQPFQIGSEHSLSHSEIAGGKRIYQHLSGPYRPAWFFDPWSPVTYKELQRTGEGSIAFLV